MAEGQGPAAAAAKKPALSNRLMQMKFMQRGKEKAISKEAVAEQEETEDDAKWVSHTPQTGCVVVTEGDPPPAAIFGHMSFSSFNPELQKLQEEREAMLATVKADANGATIPDAEMAETLSSRRHQDKTMEQTTPNKGRMPGHRPGRPVQESKQKQSKQKQHKQDASHPKTGLKRKRKHRPK